MAGINARRGVIAALLAGAVLLVLVLMSKPSHEFSIVVPAATGLVNGQRISDGANNIGAVSDIAPVQRGRAARLTLRITDERYWPLKRSTNVEIRLGGTVSFSNRYLYLKPGQGSGPDIGNGGTLAAANVKTPVEVDQLLNDITPPVRAGITGMIDNTAALADQAAPDLNATLHRTPPLARKLSGLFADLIQDKQSLNTLVRSTSRVVNAVDRANPEMKVLLDGFARTVDAIAHESSALKVGLDRLPAALRQTRETLGKAEGTLKNAAELTDGLAPGIVQLRRTAAPLGRTLTTLSQVTPLALDALSPTQKTRLTRGADLIATLGSIAPRVTSVFKQAATQVGCIRPWTPEIAAFGGTWGDWFSPVDSRDHLFRATVQNFLPVSNNSTPYTPADAAKRFQGLEYGFPRPPGALANQPWYQPQCGVDQDATDPTKDKEAQSFTQNQPPPTLGTGSTR